jgi:uncharacterized membrane protein
MNKSWLSIVGFILFIIGFVALILSLVGLRFSFLNFIDSAGPLVGFLVRIAFIAFGLILVYLSRLEGQDESDVLY